MKYSFLFILVFSCQKDEVKPTEANWVEKALMAQLALNTSLDKRISQLESTIVIMNENISRVAVLAALTNQSRRFASKISCDESIYIHGSNGHAAHEALVLSGMCEAEKPLPNFALAEPN
jgi:hypothetical protein